MKEKMTMDNIGYTNLHYKSIYNISLGIMLVLLQAYLMLIFSGMDVFNFEHAKTDAGRYVMQIFVQLIFFSFSYIAVYFIVKQVYVMRWISAHKNIWLKGTWLHIHVKKDKKEIRIGFVDISQNFYTIKAHGVNMYPECCGSECQRETSWNYVLGKIFEDDYKRDFIGVYEAEDVFNHIPKNGIHSLKIEIGGKGYPNMMIGKFGDAVKLDGHTDNLNCDAGQLYLFKPSEACKKYLDISNRNNLIYDLHTIDDFCREPFVRQLNASIKEVFGEKVSTN